MGGFGDVMIAEWARSREVRRRIYVVIRLSESFELPVGFLRQVSENYGKIYIKRGQGGDNVNTAFNSINLYEDTVKPLESMGPEGRSETTELQTFYHEMTHAFIDIKEESAPLRDIVRQAEVYYTNAPRKDGSTVGWAYRVVQEAAGAYVGHRVAHYWDALEALRILKDLYDEGTDPKVKVPDATFASLGNIAREYNRQMGRRVFGYENRYAGIFGGQISINKEIFPKLRMYCDSVILENRIKDRFSDMLRTSPDRVNPLKELIDQVKASPVARGWNPDLY